MSNNRESLLRAATLVRPALAAQAFVPALTHLKLDQQGVTAFNDISALSVRAEHELDCCVPGVLFIQALSGFKSKEVKVSPGSDNGIALSSGKSRVKLHTLPLADFPFSFPNYRSADIIRLGDDMLKGIRHCLISVGANPNHPAQMGITLEQFEGKACFFSTDNFSITRYQTKTDISLPADAPVILPTFFCEQVLALEKAFPTEELTLYLLDGGVLLEVGNAEARLYSRQPVDLMPLDFHGIIRKFVTSIDKLQKSFEPIPDGWEDALDRALLVIGDSIDKVAKMGSSRDGLQIEAQGDYGEHDETLPWSGDTAEIAINPALVKRGSAICSHLFFGKNAMVLGTQDAALIHLIAYYQQQSKK